MRIMKRSLLIIADSGVVETVEVEDVALGDEGGGVALGGEGGGVALEDEVGGVAEEGVVAGVEEGSRAA